MLRDVWHPTAAEGLSIVRSPSISAECLSWMLNFAACQFINKSTTVILVLLGLGFSLCPNHCPGVKLDA
jgi:hypothetical protein